MDLVQDLVSTLRYLPGSVQVSYEEQSTWGILRVEGKTFDDGGGRIQVLGQTRTLIIAEGAIVGLSKGSLLLVGASTTATAIKAIVPRADGSLEISLEKS